MSATLAHNERELREANADLESFSYSVSHDLRAPLRAVSGYAQMLEEDYRDSLDGEARRYIGVIRNEAGRMGELIDAILTFSRLGRRQINRNPVNVTALARQVFDDLQAPPEVAFVCGEMPEAVADPILLRQVLENLIGNAIKFSRTRPAPRIEVCGHREGDRNVYWVRDNGTGFDMRYADKLFGVFQRLHNDDYEGTGVGLAIVHRLVARHGAHTAAHGARFGNRAR